MSEHPQCSLHQVIIEEDEGKSCMPTFLGQPVPREDKGDHEYYACTMLALFKPWQMGRDLKSGGDSQSNSFLSHRFGPRARNVMKYFGVKYECLDSHDDYSTQRQNIADDNIRFHWEDNNNYDPGDFEEPIMTSPENNRDIRALQPTMLKQKGDKGTNRDYQMKLAEGTMRHVGWLDNCQNGSPDIGNISPTKPDINQPAAQWKAALQTKHQELVAECWKNLPSHSNTNHNHECLNEVKIVDNSYLLCIFNPALKRDYDLIDQTIKKFSLSKDQTQACKIISQHMVSENAKKLCMYLGGMGGTGKSQVIKALTHFFKGKGESHSFAVVAPTGSTAALLDGSMYHSFFGIGKNSNCESDNAVEEIKARLDGI